MRQLLLTTVSAFNNNGGGWKLDNEGHIVMRDGNPIIVNSSGEEQVVQRDTITRLNAEARSHREKKESLETMLKSFEGLDAEKARKAIEMVSKLDAKQLIDAGEVDAVKQKITSELQSQLNEKDSTISTLQSKIDDMTIGNIFSNSEFLKNDVTLPRDVSEAYFRRNFKIEDGNIIAIDKNGNRLWSKKTAGEYATPEEALRLLVESHPQKDVILKANPGSGSGSDGNGGNRGSSRTMTRKEFEALSHVERATIAPKIGKEINLTD